MRMSTGSYVRPELLLVAKRRQLRSEITGCRHSEKRGNQCCKTAAFCNMISRNQSGRKVLPCQIAVIRPIGKGAIRNDTGIISASQLSTQDQIWLSNAFGIFTAATIYLF